MTLGMGRLSKDLRQLQHATASVYSAREGYYIWGRRKEHGSGTAGLVRSVNEPEDRRRNVTYPGITFTVGPDGDYANWAAAWIYLQSIDPLVDNYNLRQIGVNIEAGPGWVPGLDGIDMAGHTVRLYCDWTDSHQGDPTRGYRTILTAGASMALRAGRNFPSVAADTIIVENLFIEKTDNLNTNAIFTGGRNAGESATYYLKDLIMKSTSVAAAGGRAIRMDYQRCNYYLSNIKINLFNQGIGSLIGAGVDGEHVMENISVNECAEGIGWSAGEVWNIRNCVCVECPTRGWGTLGAGNFLINCADDDATMAASGATVTNPQANIIPAEEFISTDFTNPNFLIPITGTLTLNADGTVTVMGGAPSIGKNGIEPTIEGTEIDISGYDRPGLDEEFSIGANEQRYEITNDGFGAQNLDIEAVPAFGLSPLGTQFSNIPVALDGETT